MAKRAIKKRRASTSSSSSSLIFGGIARLAQEVTEQVEKERASQFERELLELEMKWEGEEISEEEYEKQKASLVKQLEKVRKK